MSLICMCNICGKTESHGPITFNDGPISLQVENYKGELYNVDMKLSIQHDDDTKIVNKAKSISTITSNEDLDKIDEFTASNPKIKHPKPHICNACIRSLSNRVLTEGQIDPKYDIDSSVPISFIPGDSLKGSGMITEKDGIMYGEDFNDDQLVDLIMEDLKKLARTQEEIDKHNEKMEDTKDDEDDFSDGSFDDFNSNNDEDKDDK